MTAQIPPFGTAMSAAINPFRAGAQTCFSAPSFCYRASDDAWNNMLMRLRRDVHGIRHRPIINSSGKHGPGAAVNSEFCLRHALESLFGTWDNAGWPQTPSCSAADFQKHSQNRCSDEGDPSNRQRRVLGAAGAGLDEERQTTKA